MDANELASFLSGLQPGEVVMIANSSGTFTSTYRMTHQSRVLIGIGRDADPLEAVATARSVAESRI
jgi:hypothetical protein